MGSWERRRRTGMAVNYTPILLYGEDQSLQSIKIKKKNKKKGKKKVLKLKKKKKKILM